MSLMRGEDNGRCLGVVFDGLRLNVADFLALSMANLAEIEAAGTPPMKWTMAMGVEKSAKHG